jgi:hypothetical protein
MDDVLGPSDRQGLLKHTTLIFLTIPTFKTGTIRMHDGVRKLTKTETAFSKSSLYYTSAGVRAKSLTNYFEVHDFILEVNDFLYQIFKNS